MGPHYALDAAWSPFGVSWLALLRTRTPTRWVDLGFRFSGVSPGGSAGSRLV